MNPISLIIAVAALSILAGVLIETWLGWHNRWRQ